MELLDFWNGGANVLIWGRKFWVSNYIQGLRSQKCYLWSGIWGKRDYLDYEISSMSLFFRNWTSDDDLGSLEKLV